LWSTTNSTSPFVSYLLAALHLLIDRISTVPAQNVKRNDLALADNSGVEIKASCCITQEVTGLLESTAVHDEQTALG